MFTFIHNLSLTGTAYPSGAPEFTSSCSILSFLLFGHCIVRSLIYSLWLPLWYMYLHNFLSCISWFSIWLDASHIKKTNLKMKASIHVHVCKYIKMFNFRSNQISFVYFYLAVWILYNLTKYILKFLYLIKIVASLWVFSPETLVSSINKTNLLNITEILLTEPLNTHNQFYWWRKPEQSTRRKPPL